MFMSVVSKPNDSLVLSYLGLRKAIGIIGIALPFILVIGKIVLSGPGLQGSMSAYYYTIMRNAFVGGLCAIGVFLISYRGYEKLDSIAAKCATVFAIATAFFPTTPTTNATHEQIIVGNFHLAFATSLFLTLTFFALVLFRKTDPTKPMTAAKQKRNMVYTVCGYGMLLSIILAFLLSFVPKDSTIFAYSPLLWLEATMVVLFGISWLVKGEAILKDE